VTKETDRLIGHESVAKGALILITDASTLLFVQPQRVQTLVGSQSRPQHDPFLNGEISRIRQVKLLQMAMGTTQYSAK
jgi:hypothetical protein